MHVLVGDGLELAVSVPASGGFARHSHDEYVISANVCGIERVRLDRKSFTLGTDEVTLYNPAEVQSSASEVADEERWACVSIYIHPDLVRRRLGIEVEFHEPFIAAPGLRDELIQLGLLPVTANIGQRVERLIDAVFAAASLGEREVPSEVVEAQRWLADPPGATVTPPNIAEIARALGWSRESFTRRFTAATGTPPYAWHLQARLRTARGLLRRGDAPASVAARLGFTDQAHFHRHFVSAYAVTPAQFRRQIAC